MSARRDAGAVRLGPVSVFVLVMGVCLAVLAVLCLATGQAQRATAERQAATLEATYANEAAANAVLAQVEGSLAESRAAGLDLDAALAALDRALATRPEAAGPLVATYGLERDGGSIVGTFTCGGTRKLLVRLSVDERLVCTVDAWVATSDIPEDAPPQVWQGP